MAKRCVNMCSALVLTSYHVLKHMSALDLRCIPGKTECNKTLVKATLV